MEQEKSKTTKENIEKSFSLFEQSLKAHEDWLEITEMDKEATLLEVTAVSEGENNQDLLDAIEQMEPESETEFTNRIESAFKIAKELLKETQEKGKVKNALGKCAPSALRKPKAISTPFPEKLDNDPCFKLSTYKNNTRRMEINIPNYLDEPTTDITSLPSDHSRPLITDIPPALPKACEIPSGTRTVVKMCR